MSRRDQLLALGRTNPEAIVDHVLELEQRVRQSQDQIGRLEARVTELGARLA